MADDAGERTEAPTPRRRQEAREKGQIAKSPDLNSAAMLLGGMLALRFVGTHLVAAMSAAMRTHLDFSDYRSFAKLDVTEIAMRVGMIMLSGAGPILLSLVVVALVTNLVQVGPMLTTHPLQPQLERLNPLKGLGRVFNVRSLMQLAMNLLKLVVVGMVGWSAIRAHRNDVLLAMDLDGWAQVGLFAQVVYDIGLRLAIALFAIAILDFAWQKFKMDRDLRMTKQEIKEELRRMDGDPILKQRRRKMQLAAALQRIRKNVPKADVIVTNPTELAIAIKYDADTMAAPRVVAKGADYLAKKIREIAALHGIPIIEKKPLAQALYKTVEVGQEVPEQFYKAIAEILAYVYQLSGKGMKGRTAA